MELPVYCHEAGSIHGALTLLALRMTDGPQQAAQSPRHEDIVYNSGHHHVCLSGYPPFKAGLILSLLN